MGGEILGILVRWTGGSMRQPDPALYNLQHRESTFRGSTGAYFFSFSRPHIMVHQASLIVIHPAAQLWYLPQSTTVHNDSCQRSLQPIRPTIHLRAVSLTWWPWLPQ